MFGSKIISLCTRLRLNTSNLIETFTINNKFNSNFNFFIDLILIGKLKKLIVWNDLNAFCASNLNKSIIDWNVTNLNSGVNNNKYQTRNKMKDLLTTAACITKDDVLLLNTNNVNNSSNFTNGLSDGR